MHSGGGAPQNTPKMFEFGCPNLQTFPAFKPLPLLATVGHIEGILVRWAHPGHLFGGNMPPTNTLLCNHCDSSVLRGP